MRKLAAHWRGQSGFTLIEMVTVLMVIAVLTTLILVNTQTGNRRQEIRDTASEFVNQFRSAEARASAAEPVNGVSRKAYGICMTSTTSTDGNGTFPKSRCAAPQGLANAYQVYARTVADTDANPTLNQPPVNPDILSSHTFPSDVRFFPWGRYYSDYVPPRPTLYVLGRTNDASVILYSSKANYSKYIRIRPKSGAVYVE